MKYFQMLVIYTGSYELRVYTRTLDTPGQAFPPPFELFGAEGVLYLTDSLPPDVQLIRFQLDPVPGSSQTLMLEKLHQILDQLDDRGVFGEYRLDLHVYDRRHLKAKQAQPVEPETQAQKAAREMLNYLFHDNPQFFTAEVERILTAQRQKPGGA